MARFVMANRRAGKFHETEKRASRARLDYAFATQLAQSVSILGDTQPADDRARRIVVFDADPSEVAAKRAAMPHDVLLEPEILHYPTNRLRARTPWLPFTQSAQILGPVSVQPSLAVHLRGDGRDIEGAGVTLVLRGISGRSSKLEQTTPTNGQVIFSYPPFWFPTALVVVPAGNFWSYVVRGPQGQVTIDLPALPAGPLAWWHEALGITNEDPLRGAGIRVGVIDTGCGPHPALNHVGSVGAFIDGTFDIAGGADVDAHGSHVCGIIGARPPAGSRAFVGIAPGVTLLCARVFPPGEDKGADQGDIANAIDHLSKEQNVDLINMSLSAQEPSEIEHDAILDALERGTLCLCAAGNSSGAVEYPAAFPETVAVAALGLEGWGPVGTLAQTYYPSERDKYGNEGLYLANFSCVGREITCAAPGVGIISTVPTRFGLIDPSAAMDGTSMASPATCGTCWRQHRTMRLYHVT